MTDARTRGSLVAAALVAAFLLVQTIVGTITGLAYGANPGFIGVQAGSTTLEVFTRIIPIAVGVFLVFWRFLAPISGGLALRQVLLRSLVAAAAGAVIAGVIDGLFRIGSAFTGSLFGNSFPFDAFGGAFGAFAAWIASIITGFVGLVPLVALAAVLLWLWLRGRAA